MTSPNFTLFLGRLHPLLVHLPIGIIVLLAFLEGLARSQRFKEANRSAGFMLALAVPVASLAAACGWLLSLAGGYEATLLQWHKWTGVATAAGCLLAGLLYWLDLKKLYRLCLLATVMVLAVASHFGGSLTHGNDYLTRYAPAPLRALLGGGAAPPPTPTPANFANAPAFSALVQPIFDTHCVGCHGAEKSKAGLRLDSFAALVKGDENGPVITAGKSALSVLGQRLRLPLESEDHMPPDGKPQPSADEVALLEWWIDAGASGDKKIGELQPPEKIQRLLEERFGKGASGVGTVSPAPE